MHQFIRGDIDMNATSLCRSLFRHFVRILSLGAAGAGVTTVVADNQVFASLFLKDMTSVTDPEMVYSPKLQLMVRPGTDDPVFYYSQKMLRGRANGEYMVAPLVTKVSPPPPPPPPPPRSRVTPGGGRNGQGPHAD
jgi:hypothetical protein